MRACTHLVNLGWKEVDRPLVAGPLSDVAGSPPPVVILGAAEVFLTPREVLDGGEALDAVTTGRDRVHSGVQRTKLELALQGRGSLGPLGSQVLAVPAPVATRALINCK